MTLDLSLISIIDVLSVSTALMLGFLFFTVKSDNKRANLFLGLFLWSLTIEILDTVLQGFSEELNMGMSTVLFTIPLLLLYVNQTVKNELVKWYVLLFIPGILINALDYLEIDMEIFLFFDYVFNISILLHILKILNQHKGNVSNFYSDLEHKTLSWIKTIAYIYLGFHILWIIEDIVSFQNEDIIEYFANLSSILTFFMVYWIGYNGFSQSEIFKIKLFVAIEKGGISIEEENVAYEERRREFIRLKERIETEKLYTNRELNLRNLSEALQIRERELSKLINEYSKTNFYQFINGFRISEFKKLLNSPRAKQLSILGLSEEAGFSSKSTFYAAFKTLEGITPKQYELSLKMSDCK